ncbi:MAG TPA: hypothetical protein VFH33_00275, partial [Candidatus Krumholzibacteria bacterium]|nr:hypothetical protein [Candidatus Krumholzibacteria bacterium]
MRIAKRSSGLKARKFVSKLNGLVKLPVIKVVLQCQVGIGAAIVRIGTDGQFQIFSVFFDVAAFRIEVVVNVEALAVTNASAQVKGFPGRLYSPVLFAE